MQEKGFSTRSDYWRTEPGAPLRVGLVWAGSAAQRIADLERTRASDQAAIEKVAVLEEQVKGIKESLDRIESKLDQGKP